MLIFYCAGGKFGEVTGVFLTEKHSPDASLRGTGRCSCVSGALSFLVEVKGAPDAQHRTVARQCWRV